MKYVLTVSVVLALAITAHGQQGDDGPRAAAVSGEPQSNPIGQRLAELRRRAYELEQAGDLEQAAAVQRQADEERRALLARLDALEAEAERVRQALGAGTQVLVNVQVVELPIAKLRALGFDVQRIAGQSDSATPTLTNAQVPGNTQVFSIVGDDGSAIVQALRRDKLLRVLAEPTLVTLSGRTAVFEVGDVPVPKPQPDGSVAVEHQGATMLRVTPEVLGNRVRLALHCRLAELDRSRMVQVGRRTVPGVRTLEFATRAELASGETLVLAGPTQVRTEEIRDDVATYVLVRAEIVQPATASHPAVFRWQPFDPASQAARPTVAPGTVPSATARRSADREARR
ncbi:MAG: hypothetical protein JXR94_10195 [Candidatus Hydrogenedentes bacterium]|nr:hypothetical protein [Candidatus Hydrogenedentota bacterium]